jgi:hypothetical protein
MIVQLLQHASTYLNTVLSVVEDTSRVFKVSLRPHTSLILSILSEVSSLAARTDEKSLEELHLQQYEPLMRINSSDPMHISSEHS